MKLGEAIPNYQAYRNEFRTGRKIFINSIKQQKIKLSVLVMRSGHRRRRS